MKKNDFTSGEKRGLIGLIVLLALLCGMLVIYRNCGHHQDLKIEYSETSPDSETNDSIIYKPAKTSKSDKKNNKKKKQRKAKDGIKRNYRDEFTD
ncbi:MAG: hypothetical protein J1E38_08270 [Paramuribaculum sp.]|nr:hypothetical protein [Paramuribaculum sp.]